jgi:hypothetical protein
LRPPTAAEEYQPTAVASWTLAQLDRMAVTVIDFCRPTAELGRLNMTAFSGQGLSANHPIS